MKKSSYFISGVIVLLCFLSNSNAENLAFPTFSSKVSHLELDLALFDLKVNYLTVLPKNKFQYFSSISSSGPHSQNKLLVFVDVSPSIMNGSINERKKRLYDLCNNIFKEYQERFWMADLDYKMKPDEVVEPAFRMKPCNIKMHIHTSGTQSKFLAVWECGSLSYKDDFLKE